MNYSQVNRLAKEAFGPLARFWRKDGAIKCGLERGNERTELGSAGSYEMAFRMACAVLVNALKADAPTEPVTPTIPSTTI